MDSNNDNNKGSRGNRVIPSDRFEKYTGPNKEIRDQYAKWQRERESNKPGSQMESSSSTSAGSSKGKSK